MSKSLSQQQFGATASAYATSAPHARGQSLSRLVELAEPQPSWRALDVATGAGHTAAALAPRVASVIASDITSEMLQEAAKLAAAKGLTNMTTAVVDAEAIPYPDATFDLVTCRIAAHHFPDVPRFLAEVARVLRDGGTFGLVDNISPDPLSYPQFSELQLEDAARGYNAFEKLRDPSHVRCLTLGEWLDHMSRASFQVGRKEVLEKAMDFEDWIGRQRGASDVVDHLSDTLNNGPAALKALLKPREIDGRRWFSVDEAVIIAIKEPAVP